MIVDKLAEPDLVKRLRLLATRDANPGPVTVACAAADAADEIERLRAALQAIADDPDTNVEAAVYAHNCARR